jgi:light-regulated signal transduction histidine kinase (bacteriophytochrome)
MVDISELDRLNAELAHSLSELRQANQELEAFAYSVSHDLRAPLRAVDALSTLLASQEGAAMSPAGREQLSLLRASAARMDRLIGDLLEFARTSRQTPKRIKVAMLPFVRHCLEEFRAEIDQRGITVEIGPLPDANADPALLRQLLMNLLGNAVKYTRRQALPRIQVSASQDGRATVYCIQDNGAGFDMKHAAKLFRVFQRLHGEAEFEGSGVGLAIVERIVARHGGSVWAESAPGEGAAFRFTLEPAGASS